MSFPQPLFVIKRAAAFQHCYPLRLLLPTTLKFFSKILCPLLYSLFPKAGLPISVAAPSDHLSIPFAFSQMLLFFTFSEAFYMIKHCSPNSEQSVVARAQLHLPHLQNEIINTVFWRSLWELNGSIHVNCLGWCLAHSFWRNQPNQQTIHLFSLLCTSLLFLLLQTFLSFLFPTFYFFLPFVKYR